MFEIDSTTCICVQERLQKSLHQVFSRKIYSNKIQGPRLKFEMVKKLETCSSSKVSNYTSINGEMSEKSNGMSAQVSKESRNAKDWNEKRKVTILNFVNWGTHT